MGKFALMIDKTNIEEKYGFKPFPSKTEQEEFTEFIRDPFLVVFLSEELIKIQKFEEGDNGFKFGNLKHLKTIKTSKTKLFEEILEA